MLVDSGFGPDRRGLVTEFVADGILGLDGREPEAAAPAAEPPLVAVAAGGADDEDDLSEDELVSLLAARLKNIPS